ncbi:MAG: glycosyltransferase family 39 protein [Salinivirgaceae bacterium]|jgi:4-amino-4-deoxy-L-arabinose transferase-like glycosyltransferase|nr:glycosyltransferase family 39 protein [Salinivirgaceae bacterium]
MKKALLIIIALNLLRVILIPFENFIPLETAEGHFGALAIGQAPTLILSINTIVHHIVGESAFAIHFLFFSISLITQWIIYLLIKKVIRQDRKYMAWVVICSTLFFTLFAIAPVSDNLLLLFWSLSVLTLYNAIFENDKKSWLLSGVFIGFATLNKLSGIALPVGLFVFLIFSSRYRYHLFRFGPYLLMFIATLITLPLWTGLLQAESASFAISYAHTFFDILGSKFNSFTSFLGFQFIIIFPVLYIGLWWVTFKYLARIFEKPNQVNPEFWFLLSFFLPLFIGFHLIALFDWVDSFGLIPIYLTGFIVLLKLAKKRWFIWSLAFSFIAHLLLVLGILMHFIN